MNNGIYKFGPYLMKHRQSILKRSRAEVAKTSGMSNAGLENLEFGLCLAQSTRVADLIDAYGVDKEEGYWIYFNDYVMKKERSSFALVCLSLRLFLGYSTYDAAGLFSCPWTGIENDTDTLSEPAKVRFKKLFGINVNEEQKRGQVVIDYCYNKGKEAADFYFEVGYKSAVPTMSLNKELESKRFYGNSRVNKYAGRNLGTVLRTVREADDTPIRYLADKLNRTEATLSLYETGSLLPNIELIPAVAEVYGVPIIDLDKAYFNDRVESGMCSKDGTVMLAIRLAFHKTIRNLSDETKFNWERVVISKPMASMLKDKFDIDYSYVKSIKSLEDVFDYSYNKAVYVLNKL